MSKPATVAANADRHFTVAVLQIAGRGQTPKFRFFLVGV